MNIYIHTYITKINAFLNNNFIQFTLTKDNINKIIKIIPMLNIFLVKFQHRYSKKTFSVYENKLRE